MKNGQTLRDVVTGFVGVATGRVEYLTGCTQFLLNPKVDDKNTPGEGRWFDEDRLEVLAVDVIALPRTNAGCDIPAPIR
jgi:hypothetical protein